MAHVLSMAKSFVALEHEHEAIFDLLPDDGSGYSITRQLWDKFYGAMTISPGMLPQFKQELVEMRNRWSAEITPGLRRKHRINASDPQIANEILSQFLKRDTLYKVLEELIALCEDAINTGQPIECLGD